MLRVYQSLDNTHEAFRSVVATTRGREGGREGRKGGREEGREGGREGREGGREGGWEGREGGEGHQMPLAVDFPQVPL